ncbi:MAG: hypothetical protein U5L76_06035 [Patescibacteria group bacterium]|nr:hypothetical protein [Patescibacteria group bacterium]
MCELFRCPSCDYNFGHQLTNCFPYTVGYSNKPDYKKNHREQGILLLECPQCFEIIWFHYPGDIFISSVIRELKKNPKYFKVAGTKEAFLVSIKRRKKDV